MHGGPLGRIALAMTLAAALTAPPPPCAETASAQQAAAAPGTLAARLRTDRATSAREAAAAAKHLLAQRRQSEGKPVRTGSVWAACSLARLAITLEPSNADARELLGYVPAEGGAWNRNTAKREDLANAILEEEEAELAAPGKRVAAIVRAAVARFSAVARDAAADAGAAEESRRAAYRDVEAAAWNAVFDVEPANRAARDFLNLPSVEGRAYSKAVADVVANRGAVDAWLTAAIAAVPSPVPRAVDPVMAPAGQAYRAAACAGYEVTTALGEGAALRFARSAAASRAVAGELSGWRATIRQTSPIVHYVLPSAPEAKAVLARIGPANLESLQKGIEDYGIQWVHGRLAVLRCTRDEYAEDVISLYAAHAPVGAFGGESRTWLHDGLSAIALHRVLGRMSTGFGASGETSGRRKVAAGDRAEWVRRARMLVEADADVPLASLEGRPRSAILPADAIKAWSVAEYLVERNRVAMRGLLRHDPAQGIEEACVRTYSSTPAELDAAHRAWVIESR